MNDSYGTRSLREIVRILFQHFLMLLIIIVVFTVGTWAICQFVVDPRYRSQISLIYKRPANRNPLTTDSPDRGLEVFVKAQQQIVQSDLVLARAKVISEDTALRTEWYEIRGDWDKKRFEGGADAVPATEKVREFLNTGPVDAKVKDLMHKKQEELREFRRSVKLETPGGEQVAMTESFTIMVDRPAKWNEPNTANAAHYAADLIADMYMVRFQEIQENLADPAVHVMNKVVDDFRKEVMQRKETFDQFIQENVADITGLEQLLKSGTEQGLQIALTEIRKMDAVLDVELAKSRAILTAIRSVLPEKAFDPGFVASLPDETVGRLVNSIASEFLKDDVKVVELSKSLAALEGRRARIESQFREESRDLKYIREQIARVRQEMLNAIIAHARGLELRVMAREQEKKRTTELVETTALEQNKVAAKLATYSRLKNDFQIAQDQLDQLERQRIDALTQRAAAGQFITVSKLDAASMPDPSRPIMPQVWLYTIVAAIVAILIGVALAFLADHFDHTLRSAADAERYLGVPVLGSVKKRGRRLVVPK